MKRYAIGILFLVQALMYTSCLSSAPGLDQGKFKGVNHTAETVRSLLASGEDYQAFGKALQHLNDEVRTLDDARLTEPERELKKEYSVLVSIFQDGGLLWKYKLEFARYGIVPKGMIYVGQDVEPIVVKYRIPTQSFIYKPTNQAWKSIPESSIQMVSSNADSQLRIINNILNYR
ncbi:MAG: hypothetical protein HQL08_05025 [Nitrospirae bacterium]|nr:hypothetical protein [Nitrospirota bacterium]